MRDIRNPADTLSNLIFVYPLSITCQIDWHAWRTFALGFQCVDFCVNTSFGMPSGTRGFNMTIIDEIDEGNYVPIEEDKVKEDQ